jgi:ankyrin repeat protein
MRRDSRDNTAFEDAAKNCSPRAAALLIAQGADLNWINSEGRTPLITAAKNGCEPMVRQIVQRGGSKLSLQDNSGMTALDYALTEGQAEVGGAYTEIARVLKAAGAKTAQWQIPLAPSSNSPQERKLP